MRERPRSWNDTSRPARATYWKGLISRGVQGYGALASGARGSARSPDEHTGGRGATPASNRLWQRDVWDTQLRSGKHYAEQWDYVRLNPVRKELTHDPEAWPYQGEINVLRW